MDGKMESHTVSKYSFGICECDNCARVKPRAYIRGEVHVIRVETPGPYGPINIPHLYAADHCPCRARRAAPAA